MDTHTSCIGYCQLTLWNHYSDSPNWNCWLHNHRSRLISKPLNATPSRPYAGEHLPIIPQDHYSQWTTSISYITNECPTPCQQAGTSVLWSITKLFNSVWQISLLRRLRVLTISPKLVLWTLTFVIYKRHNLNTMFLKRRSTLMQFPEKIQGSRPWI